MVKKSEAQGATLSEAAIQSMVQTRGRRDGSLWKFDALGISLLINDIARTLLAAAKPVSDAWKEAVDAELTTLQSTADSYASPREAVKALIDWHIEVERYFIVNKESND